MKREIQRLCFSLEVSKGGDDYCLFVLLCFAGLSEVTVAVLPAEHYNRPGIVSTVKIFSVFFFEKVGRVEEGEGGSPLAPTLSESCCSSVPLFCCCGTTVTIEC